MPDWLPASGADGFNQGAPFEFEFAAPQQLDCMFQLIGRDGREKTQAANVDAKHGGGRTGDFMRGSEEGAVAPEHQQQIHLLGDRGGIRVNRRINPGELRGDGVADHCPSGRLDQLGGPADDAGTGGFLGISDQPDSFDSFSCAFQSTPKTLYYPPVPAVERG